MKLRLLLSFVCLRAGMGWAQQEIVPISKIADAKNGGAQIETIEPAPGVPAVTVRVLEKWEANYGDRTITYNRVAPPALQAAAPDPVPTYMAGAATPGPQLPEKREVFLFLSATVYDRRVTELHWRDAQGRHRAWSNIDFNYLRGIGRIEASDVTYSFMFGVGNEIAESVSLESPRLPPPGTFSATRSEYLIVEDHANSLPSEEALAGLDALHVYFDANKAGLIQGYIQREAERAAREQLEKDDPPTAEDTVVTFWPKLNSAYLNEK